MNCLSWNVKGISSNGKNKAIQQAIIKSKASLVLIQESKLEHVSPSFIRQCWNSHAVAFSFSPSVGRSGGLITLWDSSLLSLSTHTIHPRFIALNGVLVSDNSPVLINIYAPIPFADKALLWQEISSILDGYPHAILLGGDFHSILEISERTGLLTLPPLIDISAFNNFVDSNDPLDMPLSGRKFTWYGSGSCASRLDRFLLSPDMLNILGPVTQVAFAKGLSDHCPISLSKPHVDWGPRPFKCIDAWFDHPNYLRFVQNSWSSYRIRNSNHSLPISCSLIINGQNTKPVKLKENSCSS